MKYLRSLIPVLALALLGAGCLSKPTTVVPPTPTPAPTGAEKPSEPSLPPGTYKSVKGKTDVIRNVQFVPAGDTISSPLIITGEARLWYFEGSFPVKLLDRSGKGLVQTFASADGNWMTEEWVPFTAELIFTPSIGTNGMLVLSKDNPSDLPENDDRVEIPVKF